jgi:hypothetical protein
MPPLGAPALVAPPLPELLLLLLLPPTPTLAPPALVFPPLPPAAGSEPLPLVFTPVLPVPAVRVPPGMMPVPDTAPVPAPAGSSLLQPPAKSSAAQEAMANAQVPRRSSERGVTVEVLCILRMG